METQAPSIIDLEAQAARLTLFRNRTPASTMAERQGSAARLAAYRDGGLSTTRFAGKGHWEVHLGGDELIHILDGAAMLDMVGADGPRSFALRAGMLAVNPQGGWHRFRSAEGVTLMTATPQPGRIIEDDTEDPRQQVPGIESRMPSVIDLPAELAKLTMFRRTPGSTTADRQGSVARLAPYRDGALFAIKFAGKDHWEAHHTGDELIHILDGAATLEIMGAERPQSFPLRAGTIAVIPQGAWHRFHSAEGVTLLSATPFPGEVIEADVDDPRNAEKKPVRLS